MSSTSTTEAEPLSQKDRWRFVAFACAMSLPGVLLIVATAAMLAGLPFGADPLWKVEQVTLSEAAALHDNGEVARLIGVGEDVNGPSLVRSGILADQSLMLTPIEAAVASERADMVEVLLERGARVDEAMWTRLMCFSASVEAEDVLALLEPLHPDASVENCDLVQIPW